MCPPLNQEQLRRGAAKTSYVQLCVLCRRLCSAAGQGEGKILAATETSCEMARDALSVQQGVKKCILFQFVENFQQSFVSIC